MSPQVWIIIGIVILALSTRIHISYTSKEKANAEQERAALIQFAEHARQNIFPWPEGTSAEDQVKVLEDLKAGKPVVWYQHRTEEA